MNHGATESSIFEPQSSIEIKESSPRNQAVRAPEKKLTLFALRLAVFEKAATGLGTLGFIWATVVLLGGFAITLDKTDFWFITIILLIEATRIYGRSHELEWQRESTSSINDRKFSGENWSSGKVASRRWDASNVPLLPYALSRNVSKILNCLQLLAAIACVVLSLMKLVRRNFGEVAKGDTDKRNRNSALMIFYSLALAEALLFLLEKAYWEVKVIYCKVLEDVNKECELGKEGLVSVRRFFYDAYSRCVNGSVFDGLKMDMVSFAMELLCSNSPDEQMIGASTLCKFATNERFSSDTLQKIGVAFAVMERLVEMLNWKDQQEEEMRKSAALILSKLAGKKQNSLRVSGIPGAMESISSLLYTNQLCFDQLGLQILKKLARDHDNCGKIGNTRGLLSKIIDFTHAPERILKETNDQIVTLRRSLQVVRMLASTTGNTGKKLRREISEIVFTVSNIREILRHGDKHPALQHLGIEILRNLALEDDATERIGGTGGIIKELIKLSLREGAVVREDDGGVRIAAGEALAMLALESKSNCVRILKAGAMEELVRSLEVPLVRENAARILRNLCIYSGEDCFVQLRGIVLAVPTVLNGIMWEEDKVQEEMVGLAAPAFKLMAPQESATFFKSAGITESELASKLVQMLNKYPNPVVRLPKVRRFTVELAICMMREKQTNVHLFREKELEKELLNVLDTTSEIESFNIFSGSVGLSRYEATIQSLVHSALCLLETK